MTQVASALAQAGYLEHASTVATTAEKIAHTITSPGSQSWTLAWAAIALAQAGRLEHAVTVATTAEELACAIADPGDQVRALSLVA